MTDEAKTLTWLRGAFDTDSAPEKNLAIRKAHDLIETQAREIGRLREELAEVYIKLSGKSVHASGCATSNTPAMEPRPCNYDAEETPNDWRPHERTNK